MLVTALGSELFTMDCVFALFMHPQVLCCPTMCIRASWKNTDGVCKVEELGVTPSILCVELGGWRNNQLVTQVTHT